MNHNLSRPCLALLVGLLLGSTSRADVVVRAPFVDIRIGQPTVIRVPFFRIVLPGRRCAPPEGTVRAVVAPQPRAEQPPPEQPGQAMTVKEFAAVFKAPATGGKYEVTLLHPFTKKPVDVRLDLPPGAPKKVTATRSRLVFRYARGKPVVVRFLRDGSVRMR